ncbi:hypothetical protein SAMN04489751_0766 [Brevibacterium sandarakinum]|uniref:DUF306 domain-containing protein n=1 Tax=Brevibacterium sandarakinum TaxID=629680 RepID=A0A1H1MUX6_BRESA|nr:MULTISPECIES: hypothetical protein [Brevibacterium]RCS91341.1 hypothetical protein CIK63_04650 [Brevibacterium aurantiacum]SDR90516.1 hypothetical protein SAMN04489751_0766 [Brevibacterium sandarakinum]
MRKTASLLLLAGVLVGLSSCGASEPPEDPADLAKWALEKYSEQEDESAGDAFLEENLPDVGNTPMGIEHGVLGKACKVHGEVREGRDLLHPDTTTPFYASLECEGDSEVKSGFVEFENRRDPMVAETIVYSDEDMESSAKANSVDLQ